MGYLKGAHHIRNMVKYDFGDIGLFKDANNKELALSTAARKQVWKLYFDNNLTN